MKAHTKYQIETAQDILVKALREKKQGIAQKAEKTERAKFAIDLAEYNDQVEKLEQFMEGLKKRVAKKSSYLKLNTDSWNGKYHEIVKLKAKADSNDLFTTIGNKSFEPDFRKEEAAIEKFILELKLGTGLMSDLQKLLHMISKL